MTPEQRYDRLERIAELLCEAALRANRESRKQLKQLRAMVDARKRYDEAKPAVTKSGPETQTGDDCNETQLKHP